MKKEIEEFRDKMKETRIELIKSGEDTSVEMNAYGTAKLFLTAASMAQGLLEYMDAAEFEARVGELLTGEINPCYFWGNCPKMLEGDNMCTRRSINARECALKYARLAVEAEMEEQEK